MPENTSSFLIQDKVLHLISFQRYKIDIQKFNVEFETVQRPPNVASFAVYVQARLEYISRLAFLRCV